MVPTTLAGLAAVLAYVVSESDRLSGADLDVFYFDDDFGNDPLRSVDRALRPCAGGAAMSAFQAKTRTEMSHTVFLKT